MPDAIGDEELETNMPSSGACPTEGDAKNDLLVPPVVGMTFESFEEAQAYYNRYAFKVGFVTKIKNSWFSKSKVKERLGAVLTCCKEGFREGKRPSRPILRIGCKAMMRIKLTESRSWKVMQVHIEHNHECCPSKTRLWGAHKKLDVGKKRRLELYVEPGIQTNTSFQTVFIDAREHDIPSVERDSQSNAEKVKRLKLEEGDVEAIHRYFCRMQLKNANFFYLMDLNNDGCLRNVFWADARARAAHVYFGDVVTFDTAYLTNRYDLRLATFVGVNHHGQCVLLGCGVVVDDTTQTYSWLFKAWLTCMLGHPPSAIITDQCVAIQRAVSDVFPKSCHRLCLWHIMKKLPDKLGEVKDYEAVKIALQNAIYDSMTVNEFEMAWRNLINGYGLAENEWLKMLYEVRQQWVPAFLKDSLFAGMSTIQRSDKVTSFFDGYVHPKTSLKEFMDQYEFVLKDKYEKEIQADFESFHKNPVLKTRCYYERQLADLYTSNMFKKFQDEVCSMVCCFNPSQVRIDGSVITYIIKEHVFANDGSWLEPKDYEVLFNTGKVEVRCSCGLFQFKGFLCRHALYVLNNNGVKEIPSQYILPRWRKDFKRKYTLGHCSSNMLASNPTQLYDALYPCAIQLVEEGVISASKYEFILQGIQKLLNKAHLLDDYTHEVTNEHEINPNKRGKSHGNHTCGQGSFVGSNGNVNGCEDAETNMPHASVTESIKVPDPSEAMWVSLPKQNKLQSSSQRNIRNNSKKQKDTPRTSKVDKQQHALPVAQTTQNFGNRIGTQDSILITERTDPIILTIGNQQMFYLSEPIGYQSGMQWGIQHRIVPTTSKFDDQIGTQESILITDGTHPTELTIGNQQRVGNFDPLA